MDWAIAQLPGQQYVAICNTGFRLAVARLSSKPFNHIMAKRYRITLLPGDGIGPEIMAVTVEILQQVGRQFHLEFDFESALIGGAAIDATDNPLPSETLEACRHSDAVLLAAIGGTQWDKLPSHQRPERGLLGLRAGLELFANLRPAKILPQLVEASSLKREVVDGVDIMVVRELTGGIYFGQPKGIFATESGESGGSIRWLTLKPKLTALAVLPLKQLESARADCVRSIRPTCWMSRSFGAIASPL